MRLYRRHDVDLLSIYAHPNYSLQKTIKKAVLAYINQQDIKIAYPQCEETISQLPSTLQFQLYLSKTNKDDKIISECIAQIPPGFKNSFLKNITRYYMPPPKTFEFNENNIKIE